MSDVETGKSLPSCQMLVGLSKEYGVSMEWLLSGTGQPFTESPEIRLANEDCEQAYADEDLEHLATMSRRELRPLAQAIARNRKLLNLICQEKGVPNLASEPSDPFWVDMLHKFNKVYYYGSKEQKRLLATMIKSLANGQPLEEETSESPDGATKTA